MKAMRLESICSLDRNSEPLTLTEIPRPEPGPGQLLLEVTACGVCHTELDEIEGRTPPPRLPVTPGHQVVGRVAEAGPGADRSRIDEIAGVAWIWSACGHCRHCLSGNENLCPNFLATGRDADGGYAEYMRVPEEFAHPIPPMISAAEAAPLLCAGGVGYRSLRLAGIQNGGTLGFYGLGASAHLVIQMARHEYPDASLYVFTRSESKQEFARGLGADWSGAPGDEPPSLMDAVIDTTPVWRPIEEGLRLLGPGGRLVVNAIRKINADRDALGDIHYHTHLWMERELTTVANVTREDIRRALAVAAEIPIRPTVETYGLEDANRALVELKESEGRGAKVLVMS